MAKKKQKKRVFKPGDRAVFMFSFHEHDGEGFDEEPTEQEIVQTVASWDWEFQRMGKPGAGIYDKIEFEPTSVEALMALARESMDGYMPEVAIQLPFDKLKALMEQGGWRFVCGDYMEMEGNHNDTEISALLEKL
jgi:hypothetical protein